MSIPIAIHVTLSSYLGNGKAAFFTGTRRLGNLADFFTAGIGLANEDQPVCIGLVFKAPILSHLLNFILELFDHLPSRQSNPNPSVEINVHLCREPVMHDEFLEKGGSGIEVHPMIRSVLPVWIVCNPARLASV